MTAGGSKINDGQCRRAPQEGVPQEGFTGQKGHGLTWKRTIPPPLLTLGKRMPATLAAMADSRHRGFTLIEIGVVLLVIFVLAAIAIPTYKTYKLQAQGEYGHLVIHLEGEPAAPVSTFARAASVMATPSGPESAFPQAIEERFAD